MQQSYVKSNISLNDFFVCRATEGQLISCSYDYLSEDMNSVSFVLYAYIFNYCVPVSSCIFFYSQIVMAVVKHEKALKEQAKKMNVESLRSGDHAEQVWDH